VQDEQGRPIAIGLEDLLDGLEKHWQEQPTDLQRARVYAQKLLEFQKLQKAEQVLSKLVAKGGSGDDWLALGVAQLQQEKFDKAEGTLKGASNLLKESPYPHIHLARLYNKKGDHDAEQKELDQALERDAGSVDAWAQMFHSLRDQHGEDKAISTMEERAKGMRNAAPWVALQGFYATEAETRPRAIEFAKKGVEANSDDPIALLCLSALYGQSGDLAAVVDLLSKHETKMSKNVHLANNYFEALFQTRQIEKVTKLLNSLAGSQNQEVKKFAIQRSQLVAQFLQQQQAKLTAAPKA
jgi:tetratricopeptide (TPR) repeat protein